MKQAFDPADFLGPAGAIAGTLKGYEPREQQIAMARGTGDALEQGYHLIVEAGTGVGKSFAYLAAVLEAVAKRKQKSVISTYTIALQEQLIRKDIPFIRQVSDIEFTAVLAKGRGNYLCWRRLVQAEKRQLNLFEKAEELNDLAAVKAWALQTQDGTLSDLPRKPAASVWEMVSSDKHSCLGRNCGHGNDCFYQKARKRLFGADVIVTNHALLFSDLALKLQGSSFLPRFESVVLDEAHNVEHVASQHFGIRVSNFQVSFLLNRLYNPKTQKGLLADKADETLVKLINEANTMADLFFNDVLSFHDHEEMTQGNGRVKEAGLFKQVLGRPLLELTSYLQEQAAGATDEEENVELSAYADRCAGLNEALTDFADQRAEEQVYWVEANRRRRYVAASVHSAPLHVGPYLEKALYEPCKSVVLTSATLCTQTRHGQEVEEGTKGFSFFAERMGVKDYEGLQLGSPFDYERQVQVYVAAYLPEPTLQEGAFLEEATEAVKHYLLETQGSAFILCTSFRQIRQLAKSLEGFCAAERMSLLEQGKELDRSRLLDEFRRQKNAVLLGTDSFWQGVDIQGEALRNVIIVKLPFSVPDHPLLQARLEQIRAEGGSAFFDYQLPEAILKFKQGFGRLIRSKQDTGIVVILDPRVVTKGYGGRFLRALPGCPVEIVKDKPL